MDKGNQWLLIEKKYFGGLTQGQEIKFKKFWKETTTHAVLIIYGPEIAPQSIEIWPAGGEISYRFFNVTHDTLKHLFRVWYKAAEKNKAADFKSEWYNHIEKLTQQYVSA